MKLPQRFEVKPRTTRNVISAALAFGFFVLLGFFTIATGGLGILVGLLVIFFFGGGGLFTIPKLARRSVSMILTSDGLHQISPYGDVVILWQDVESIGISSIYSNKMVGLRLKTYDRYVNNLPLQLAENMKKFLPYLKFFAVSSSFMPVPKSVKLWSALEGRGNPAEALRSFGKVGTIVESMLWSREKYGYDILLVSYDLDRSAVKFVQLLEQYRQAAEMGYQ